MYAGGSPHAVEKRKNVMGKSENRDQRGKKREIVTVTIYWLEWADGYALQARSSISTGGFLR
jgi:hypothetical protein